MLYAFRLRTASGMALALSARNGGLLRAGTAVLIGIVLFSSASNYATVEGTELERHFEERIPLLPRVVVHSPTPLNLEALGVALTMISGEGYEFRDEGLRLLEHVGGQYFRVRHGLRREFGVVMTLRDDDPDIRFDFVRDNR